MTSQLKWVIRLPPFGFKYNPIELIWAQVKGQVAKCFNNTLKMVDIERSTHLALDAVTIDDWKKCAHTEETQDNKKKKKIMRHHDGTNIYDNITR